jgi:hypothetical protein
MLTRRCPSKIGRRRFVRLIEFLRSRDSPCAIEFALRLATITLLTRYLASGHVMRVLATFRLIAR